MIDSRFLHLIGLAAVGGTMMPGRPRLQTVSHAGNAQASENTLALLFCSKRMLRWITFYEFYLPHLFTLSNYILQTEKKVILDVM